MTRLEVPLVVVFLAASAGAASTPPEEAPGGASLYARALTEVAVSLDRGDWDAARAQARDLRGRRFAAGAAVFEADPALVGAVLEVKDGASSNRAKARVRRVIASLVRRDEALPAEAATLARVAREEAAGRPTPGGDVDVSLVPRPGVPERLRSWVEAAADWAARWLKRLWRWLTRFPRGPAREEDARGTTAAVVTVLVAAIVAVLAWAAVRSVRRRDRTEPPSGTADASASARDENPLSREADEWERYAAELAAAGRRREAVRAWYHAVLVTLFRAGLLHHQKGRTNWEYVAELDPGLAWHPFFVDLTQAFDREWYGREQSTADALRLCASVARDVLGAARAGGAA